MVYPATNGLVPMLPSQRLITAGLLGALLVVSGCSTLTPRDPVRVELTGLEPLPGQGLEVRFAAVLRVQNPNESAITYNGVALDLEVNHRSLASGVSPQAGHVPRFGEALIRVPVSITALAAMRQAWAAAGYQQGEGLPYRVSGKLANGLFGTVRFSDDGTLNWPERASPYLTPVP